MKVGVYVYGDVWGVVVGFELPSEEVVVELVNRSSYVSSGWERVLRRRMGIDLVLDLNLGCVDGSGSGVGEVMVNRRVCGQE